MVGIDAVIVVFVIIFAFIFGVILGVTGMRGKYKNLIDSKKEHNRYYARIYNPEAMVEAQLAARRIREARDNGRKTMPREDTGAPAVVHRNQFRRARRRRYWSPPGF